MRLVKATELARKLGISRRTVSGWCREDPSLAFKKAGIYYIRVDALAVKPGMNIIEALTVMDQHWIKAVDLALIADCPRRSMAYWCKTRPHLAKRIGRIWYVDLAKLGATEEQVEALRKWAPDKQNVIKVLEVASILGKPRNQEEGTNESD